VKIYSIDKDAKFVIPPKPEKKVMVSLRIERKLIEVVRMIAQRNNTTASEVIRAACLCALDKFKRSK
jgi:hypothetical protein